jgi:hypothetical protein
MDEQPFRQYMVSWLCNGSVIQFLKVSRVTEDEYEQVMSPELVLIEGRTQKGLAKPGPGFHLLWKWVHGTADEHGLNVPVGVDKYIGKGASSIVYRLADGSGVLKVFHAHTGPQLNLDAVLENEARVMKRIAVLKADVGFAVSDGGKVEEVKLAALNAPPRLTLTSRAKNTLACTPLGEAITHEDFARSRHQHQLVADCVNFLFMLARNKYCHCDVRSPNILVVGQSRGMFIDFGFSHAEHEECVSHPGRKCSPAQDLLNLVSVVHMWLHGVRLTSASPASEGSLLQLRDVPFLLDHCKPAWRPIINAAGKGNHRAVLEYLLDVLEDGMAVSAEV